MLRSPSVRDRASFHRGKNILVSCVAALVLLTAAPASAAPILSVSPSSQTVTVGQTFSVDFLISGVTDLYSFQFGIAYDPTIIGFLGVTEGSFLSNAGATAFVPGFDDPFLGYVFFNAVSLVGQIAGASGNGVLLTASFAALAPGTSLVAADFNIFVLDELLDSTLTSIAFTNNGGSVTVRAASVPESSSLSMLLLGVALSIVAVRWRRTNTATYPVR
jgi:hypothetical protein